MADSDDPPYTIEDKGRTIRIVVRRGYGEWYCFTCLQSGTTNREPMGRDAEMMAESYGRAHQCTTPGA
jgi:hypothetical protein